jgi:glycosyltransferase involved in cell wall biosynthesis
LARVLWWGDAGCHTGFAHVTHAIGDRLVSDYGHEVSVLAINYLGDYWPTPMHLYRANKVTPLDTYGQSRVIELLAEVMPEVVVLLNDPIPILKFLFDNRHDPERKLLQFAPIIAYIPIDGHSYPPKVDLLGKVTTRVAMSQYGATQLPPVPLGRDGQGELSPPARVIYHGVDTELFRPVSLAAPMVSSGGKVVTSKREAKMAFGYDPDCFLVLRVDRNSSRKAYADTWKALVPVMKRHDDVVAHFHCLAIGDEFNLRELVSRDPGTADRFKFPANITTFQGWPEQDMAILFNAADLYVSTAWGEGYGLSLAQAAATGLPIVAQNASAIPEVAGPAGRLIEPQREITTPMGHEQWQADVPAFSRAIEELYSARGSRRKMGEAGRQHITAHNWDESARQFDSLIGELTQRSSRGSEAGSAPGADPGSAVQHRDEGDGGEGGRERPPEPALHSLVDG